MKFEIVQFYPFMRHPKRGSRKSNPRDPIGTFHVYWIDQEMHLRGIPCHVSPQDGIYYQLPFLFNFNPVSARIERYPVFSFLSVTKVVEFYNFLKKEGNPRVEKYLQEHPEFDKRLKSKEVKA